ncbi:MAG: hypothetical protein JWL86_5334 [Rhizobium sp.]|nr:hypothetical protein [Rhizobium sp.]
MARFRCRACGDDGTFVYDGRHLCPSCGSPDVQFAIGVEEIGEDDPFVLAMNEIANQDGETNED